MISSIKHREEYDREIEKNNKLYDRTIFLCNKIISQLNEEINKIFDSIENDEYKCSEQKEQIKSLTLQKYDREIDKYEEERRFLLDEKLNAEVSIYRKYC